MVDLTTNYDCSPNTKCTGFSQCMLAKMPSEVIPGQDLNHQNELGWTALMIHARNGNFPMVQYLISTGVDVNTRNNKGYTALHKASVNSTNKDIVLALISAGADLNVQDRFGWTALHLAAGYSTKGSSEQTVAMLISAGANLELINIQGKTALHLAAAFSTSTSSDKTVEMLIFAGANVNLKSLTGKTPLAVTDNDTVAARLLIAGADIKDLKRDLASVMKLIVTQLTTVTKDLEELRLDSMLHREFYEHYHGYSQLGCN